LGTASKASRELLAVAEYRTFSAVSVAKIPYQQRRVSIDSTPRGDAQYEMNGEFA
jgi:hypothetical protein